MDEERLATHTDNGGVIPTVPELRPHESSNNQFPETSVIEIDLQDGIKARSEPKHSRGKSLKFDRYGFVIGEDKTEDQTSSEECQTTMAEDTTTGNNSDLHQQLEVDEVNDRNTKLYQSEKSKVNFTFLKKWAPIGVRAVRATADTASDENAVDNHRHHQEESLAIQKRRGADIPELEMERRLKLEKVREQKWQKMLQKWSRHHNSKTKKNSDKLKRRIRKGIPNDLRGRAWSMLADVPIKMQQNPNRYEQLVWSKEIPSQDTRDVIERDIHRTFPRHALFIEDRRNSYLSVESNGENEITGLAEKLLQVDVYANRVFNCGNDAKTVVDDNADVTSTSSKLLGDELLRAKGGQASLRRVLRAYSLYDTDVGYCQGMNFIAATLITFMEEEEAFWMLVGKCSNCVSFLHVYLFQINFANVVTIFFLLKAVMNEQPTNMRGLFGENMQQTQQILDTSEKLIKDFLPVLYKHFEKENIHITMFVTQWMLTVFTSSFPFDLVVRVWDCFLAEGYKIVYRVMLALLKLSSQDLLQLPFEEILAYLQRLPSKIDGHQVMETAFGINLKRKQIAKYERQYYSQLESTTTGSST